MERRSRGEAAAKRRCGDPARRRGAARGGCDLHRVQDADAALGAHGRATLPHPARAPRGP